MAKDKLKSSIGIGKTSILVMAMALIVIASATTASATTASAAEQRSQVFQDVTNADEHVTGITWEALHYDLDTGINTENISWTTDANGVIDENNLTYTSTPETDSYDYSAFGNHYVMGVLGEEYVPINNDTETNVKLLIDKSSDVSLQSGESLELKQGYSININQVDVSGDKVLWAITKDGEVVDEGVAEPGKNASSKQNITHTTDIDTHSDVEVIKAHIDAVFRGETNTVIIDGHYQLSTEKTTAEDFETGVFDDSEGGETVPLQMNSDSDIELNSDKTINLFGDAGIKTGEDATDSTRRYYLFQTVEQEITTTEPTTTATATETEATAPTETTNETKTATATDVPLETNESTETGATGPDETGDGNEGTPTTPGFTALAAITGALAAMYGITRYRN